MSWVRTARILSIKTDEIGTGFKRSTYICNSCKNNITQRRHASIATAPAADDVSSGQQSLDGLNGERHSPQSQATGQASVTVKAGIVVSRAPLITPEAHTFETAFHLYQRRLNERLALPFTQYFHFKRGTPAYEHWRTKRRERGGVAARDIGNYNAYNKEGWNDEVLVGEQCGTPTKIIEKLIAEEGRGSDFAAGDEEAAKLGGLKRSVSTETEANQQSLDRKLDRTLYLLVKDKQSESQQSWRFPSGTIQQAEGLKEVCESVSSVQLLTFSRPPQECLMMPAV